MTQPPASITSMTAPAARAYRDAVIVLPGIFKQDDFSLRAVARRLAIAMDNSAPAPASFRVADARTVPCGAREHSVVTIHRHEHGAEHALVDVYEFDYHQALTGLQARDTPVRQLVAMAMTLVSILPRLLRSLRRPSQRLPDKLQLWIGVFLSIIILLYFGTLACTVIGSLLASLPPSWSEWLTSLQARLHASRLDSAKTALLTIALMVSSTRLNVRAALGTIGPAFSCSIDYLTAGKRRSQITGELARLIDHLDEQSGVEYRRVHLMAYSFGSIIALDALFPPEAEVVRRLQRVDTFVSIGCGFDFIRTYWPHYFERRHAGAAPQRWLNIYCDLDILGSNFVDETYVTSPQLPCERELRGAEPRASSSMDDPEVAPMRMHGVEVRDAKSRRPTTNLSFGPSVEEHGNFWEYAKLIGFRAHSMYWDRDSEDAISCFGPVVDFLWPEDASTPRTREVA